MNNNEKTNQIFIIMKIVKINISLFTKLTFLILLLQIYSCTEEYLDYKPTGVISYDDINNPDGAEKLVTAAYASLGNDARDFSSYSVNWLWGSIRSDDAYKGGGSVADGRERRLYETFTQITNSDLPIHRAWIRLYEAISRANQALAVINDIDEAEYPLKLERQAEMRFLRAHFHFRLLIIFKNICWIDETVAESDYKTISNREFTRDQLLDKIAQEFMFAKDNLPDVQEQVGRASAVAAAAYLARVRLYQAYEQDEQHNMVNINATRLEQVIDATDYVISSGKHSLHDDYAKNFLWEYDNGVESIFAIQYSRDDNTPNGGRLNYAFGLVYNMSPRYGCCDFHKPSHNMVNAFKTDSAGLPQFDTFNDEVLDDSLDYFTNSFDPRISHTVGIPGHPFKYDPEFIFEYGWNRAPEIYGYYSDMKNVQHPDCPCYKKYGPFHASSKNYDILRYDDVLLMKAEALIELGREDEALPLINMLRNRAANSTDRVRYANGSPPANYNIQPYTDGVNCTWSQDFARKALRWERRLEFGMEGWRFFDLVRWGIAAETLNDYFEVEKTRRFHLEVAYFEKNKNEYVPIPEQEIVLSEGLYQQNPGY